MIGVRGNFEFLDGFAHQASLFHQASNYHVRDGPL
jgi:hypothetical protein